MRDASPPWTDEQNAVILANPDLLGRELKPLVNAVGPERTQKAVEVRRLTLAGRRKGQTPLRPGYNASTQPSPWPVLPRTPEWRDAQFVRSFIRAAVAEGVMRVSG